MADLATWIADLIHNDLFAGGLALGAAGIAGAVGHLLLRVAVRLLKKRFVVSIDVQSTDVDVAAAVLRWVDTMQYGHTCRRLEAVGAEDDGERDGPPTIWFAPGVGDHVFRAGRTWVHLDRRPPESGNHRDKRKGGRLTLNVLTRSPDIARALLSDVVARYGGRPAGHIRIYSYSYDIGYWSRLCDVQPRPLKTVILAPGIRDRISQDVRRFLDSESWYRERGVPWRRGILLAGPPGTGKSSLVRGLAGQFGLDIAVVEPSLARGDSRFTAALAEAPQRAILLLEDVDALIQDREVPKGKVTFSGILNALDGVASQEGRLLIMTTNKLDCLDPALIRPGRIDVSFCIDLAVPDQAAALFTRFYPEASPLQIQQLRDAYKGQRLSPAELQGVFLANVDDPANAVREVGRRASSSG